MGLLTNPRQTIIVTCRSHAHIMGKKKEKDNAITIDWHMPLSFNPKMYAICVGKSRFSHKLISESKAFVVNFLPYTMEKEALYCGRHTGEHHDKIADAGLKTHEAENLDCPRIVGAVAYLECEVQQEISIGDHTLFIGKVVNSDKIKEEKRLFHVDHDEFSTTK